MNQPTPDPQFWSDVHPTELTGAALALARAYLDGDFQRLWALARETDARLLVAALIGPLAAIGIAVHGSADGFLAYLAATHETVRRGTAA